MITQTEFFLQNLVTIHTERCTVYLKCHIKPGSSKINAVRRNEIVLELRERLELGDTLTCLRQSLNLMQFQATSILGMQYCTNLNANCLKSVALMIKISKM